MAYRIVYFRSQRNVAELIDFAEHAPGNVKYYKMYAIHNTGANKVRNYTSKVDWYL